MAKTLHCRDLGFAEDHTICGRDEQELLRRAAEHAKTMHRKPQFSAAEMERVRSVIRDEKQCPSIR